jgi:hypothetical protein
VSRDSVPRVNLDLVTYTLDDRFHAVLIVRSMYILYICIHTYTECFIKSFTLVFRILIVVFQMVCVCVCVLARARELRKHLQFNDRIVCAP